MGELKEKIRGIANEAVGNAKQVAGKHQRDPELQEEGITQERKGEMQNLKGKIQGAFDNKI